MNPVGDTIKSRRLFLGLTQGELGEKTGFTQAQISHWESGFRTPSVEQLEQLAKVFGSFVIG